MHPSVAALICIVVLAACAGPTGAVPSPSGPPATAGPTAGSPGATAQSTAVPPAAPTAAATPGPVALQEFPVKAGSRPHDVAPAADGGVWYTGQGNGTLGHLDPRTGAVREVRLGSGSSPHGVIVDRNGVAWVTDSGLNAIVSVDPHASDAVKRYPLPAGTPNVNLNTAVIDRGGVLWWTGQNGWFGRLDPDGTQTAFEAPRGRGPYGITTTPAGDVFYVSLAGSHLAQVVKPTGGATVIEPPTPGQGARRAWSDSTGMVWVSEYNAGQLARYDPATRLWREWKLPGNALAYSVFVDDRDIVWLTDFAASAIVRFDPVSGRFDSYPHAPGGNVRQQLGRPGEVWGALSAHDRLLLVRTKTPDTPDLRRGEVHRR